ncbi:MAG: metal-dependent hydrolase [Spirochaetales bacterium]|nr:metal-dependent hydrolase [Spirochaetales bacterium]
MSRITWLGHSTFSIEFESGVRLLTDPWIRDNPACPVSLESITELDVITVTHGHYDHFADAAELAQQTGATVIASPDLVWYLDKKGIAREKQAIGLAAGGTARVEGLAITMVQAVHGSELYADEWRESKTILPGGGSCGYVFGPVEDPSLRFYFAGDTDVFSDMQTIAELHKPVLSFLPVGDKYTMGIEGASLSAQWLGSRVVVPMHYNTNPGVAQDADAIVKRVTERAPGTEVVIMKPGESYEFQHKA